MQYKVTKTTSKEFAFTRLISYGSRGSGITAEEKFKHQKNGAIHRYVYYICCKGKDKMCKGQSINEDDLLEQILGLIDKLSIDELGMRGKLQKEVDRYQKFRTSVLGKNKDEVELEMSMKNYAKYLLKEGQVFEKRLLLEGLKSKVRLDNKKLHMVEF